MTGEQEERFDHIDDIFERLGGDARRHHVPAELLEVKTERDLGRARQIVNEAIEAGLEGSPLSPEVIGRCEAAARDEISPITDVRASAAYRQEVVAVTLRRMLDLAERS